MRILSALFLSSLLAVIAFPQKADVALVLNEAFFDAALDAVLTGGPPVEFPLAQRTAPATSEVQQMAASFAPAAVIPLNECSETIHIQREINGVRSAVRFREGKILASLAFSGNYNPTFVGCVGFSGWAESMIDLEFDANTQRLVARVRVINVNLSGSGGIGGSVIAKLVQNSIDKKINPIELFPLNKLSFAVPMKGSSDLQMRATGIRHELGNGAINVVVTYEFVR